jgi:hypothetical protein
VTATIAVQHRRVTQVSVEGQDDGTNNANRFAEMGCTSELTEVLFAYRECHPVQPMAVRPVTQPLTRRLRLRFIIVVLVKELLAPFCKDIPNTSRQRNCFLARS